MTSDRWNKPILQLLDEQAREFAESEAAPPDFGRALIGSSVEEQIALAKTLAAHEEPERRVLGARLLRHHIKAPSAQPLLRRVISTETDAEVLIWILIAARETNDPGLIPALTVLSRHDDATVRELVADATTGASGAELSEDALDILECLAQDDDPDVIYSAAIELAYWWAEGFRNDRVGISLRSAIDRLDSDASAEVLGLMEDPDMDEQPLAPRVP